MNALALLNIQYPIIQAPMAGGATTPELIAAVSNAGGLGSLGAAFLSAEQLLENIQAIRKQTDKPFNVNLFVPAPHQLDKNKLSKMKEKLAVYFDQYQLSFPELKPPFYQDINKLTDVSIEHKVSIVSFMFGIPEQVILDKLKKAGIVLIGTATTVEEAIAIEKQGFDAVVAQGSEAGGHRGTFLKPYDDSLVPLHTLIPDVVKRVSIPVIAAGGIMNSNDIEKALKLGASAVQMGTVFLTCKEAGIPDCYKQRLLNAKTDTTVLTKAFTGRPARGLRNQFTDSFADCDEALLDFPIQGALTKALRQAATKEQNTELMSLWAGQGVALSRDLSASALMHELIRFVS